MSSGRFEKVVEDDDTDDFPSEDLDRLPSSQSSRPTGTRGGRPGPQRKPEKRAEKRGVSSNEKRSSNSSVEEFSDGFVKDETEESDDVIDAQINEMYTLHREQLSARSRSRPETASRLRPDSAKTADNSLTGGVVGGAGGRDADDGSGAPPIQSVAGGGPPSAASRTASRVSQREEETEDGLVSGRSSSPSTSSPRQHRQPQPQSQPQQHQHQPPASSSSSFSSPKRPGSVPSRVEVVPFQPQPPPPKDSSRSSPARPTVDLSGKMVSGGNPRMTPRPGSSTSRSVPTRENTGPTPSARERPASSISAISAASSQGTRPLSHRSATGSALGELDPMARSHVRLEMEAARQAEEDKARAKAVEQDLRRLEWDTLKMLEEANEWASSMGESRTFRAFKPAEKSSAMSVHVYENNIKIRELTISMFAKRYQRIKERYQARNKVAPPSQSSAAAQGSHKVSAAENRERCKREIRAVLLETVQLISKLQSQVDTLNKKGGRFSPYVG